MRSEPQSHLADSTGAAPREISRRAIVVLGMHRSGTSAMTRVLALSGAQLPNDVIPATKDNERGYWESASVLALNDEILEAYDSGWDDVFAGRPKHYLSNFDTNFRQKASEVLAATFSGADTIVLKDPRINVLAAFWDRALKLDGYDPAYVVMVRNPLEVAASMLKRDGMPIDEGLLLWLDQMLAVERDTRDAKRLFVAFDDLLHDWRGCLDRVEDATGVPLPRRTNFTANAIDQFLSPSLRHHRSAEEDLQARSKLRNMAGEAYAWFLAATSLAGPGDTKVLEELRDSLESLYETIGPVLAYQHGRITEHRNHIAEFRKHTNGLEERVLHLQNEVERSLTAASGVEAQRLRLETTLETVEASNALFKDRAEQSEARLIELDAEIAEYRKHTTGLEELVLHLQQEAQRSLANANEAEAEIAEYRKHTTGLEQRVAHLQNDLDQAREGAATAQDERRQLFEQSEARMTELNAEIAGYRKQMNGQEELVAHLQRELDQAREGATELAGANERMQADIAGFRDREAGLINEADAARRQLDQERRGTQGYEQENEALERRANELRLEVIRLQGVADTTFALNRSLNLKSEEAQNERVQRERLEAQLQRTRDEMQDTHNELRSVRDELQGARDELRGTQKGVISAQEELVISQKQLSIAHNEISELQRERANILNSTTWRLSSVPRRFLSNFRKH